ncbi:diaminobutyrate--2-oxoglutarate transaminase [Bradyrhizobium sp. 2TAF24]|uniref:diaminobutyrate--2-oxoglutarate transaminase n=1 Tax=Bradyrhizobium sp. 2TAF24 TaxID=3233011 RepID=UPI003F908209
MLHTPSDLPIRSEHSSGDNDVFASLESDVRSYCRRFPRVFATAKGHLLTDEDGHAYIDFLSGAGVLNYGHNNDAITARVLDYMQQHGVIQGLDLHTTAKRDFLTTFETTILAPRHLNYKVQFTGPTGSSAVEAALKLARRLRPQRPIAAFTNAYHGMSLGALSATGDGPMRRASGVTLQDIVRLPFDGFFGDSVNTLSYIDALLSEPGSGVEAPAAFILETVQAEGGLKVASRSWLRGLAELARKHDALLIVDEIQTGCGRTGPFFSFEDTGIAPDIVCVSKSIGGIGFPMALVLMKDTLDAWRPGEHIGTFRGNNLAFVAATAALDTYWRDATFEQTTRRKGESIQARLQQMADRCPDGQARVRGRGMIRGLEWDNADIAMAVSAAAFKRGLIVETCGSREQVLKLLPPLTIDDASLAAGLDRLDDAVDDVYRSTEPQVAFRQSA